MWNRQTRKNQEQRCGIIQFLLQMTRISHKKCRLRGFSVCTRALYLNGSVCTLWWAYVCVCVCLRCSRSVKLCVAAREPGCLNVVRQFLITWPSARAAAEWLTTVLEHYWRKQKERRGDGTRPVTEEEDEERWRSKKEGMRRGKSCRKRKHQQYRRLIGMHWWVCSKNCFGYIGHHSIVISNDFSHKKRKSN